MIRRVAWCVSLSHACAVKMTEPIELLFRDCPGSKARCSLLEWDSIWPSPNYFGHLLNIVSEHSESDPCNWHFVQLNELRAKCRLLTRSYVWTDLHYYLAEKRQCLRDFAEWFHAVYRQRVVGYTSCFLS